MPLPSIDVFFYLSPWALLSDAGGPFRYVDAVGADEFVDMMNGFADKYGPQFAPCELLQEHAREKKPFHINTE